MEEQVKPIQNRISPRQIIPQNPINNVDVGKSGKRKRSVVFIILFGFLILYIFAVLLFRNTLSIKFLFTLVIVPLLLLIFLLSIHSKERLFNQGQGRRILVISLVISILWIPVYFLIYPPCFFGCAYGYSLGYLDLIIKIPVFLPTVILSPLHKIEAGFSLAIILGPILWFSEFYAVVYLIDKLISIFKTRGKVVSLETSENVKPIDEMNLKRSLPQFEEPKKDVQLPQTE